MSAGNEMTQPDLAQAHLGKSPLGNPPPTWYAIRVGWRS